MKKSPLNSFASQISARKNRISAEYAPKIRAYFLELFRTAHAVEPNLTGMEAGMGTATATGFYTVTDEDEPEEGSWLMKAHKWSPGQCYKTHPEVDYFLSEIQAYSDRLCGGRHDDLPYIEPITLADL